MRKLCIVIGMLWLCVTSCGDSYESSIPSVTFNFSCSLSQSPYYKITTPGQFLKIEKNVKWTAGGLCGLIIGQRRFSQRGILMLLMMQLVRWRLVVGGGQGRWIGDGRMS